MQIYGVALSIEFFTGTVTRALATYFWGAGLAGCPLVCGDLRFCSTDPFPVRRDAVMESVIEVNMKITAHQVVALVRTVAAPRGPNAV